MHYPMSPQTPNFTVLVSVGQLRLAHMVVLLKLVSLLSMASLLCADVPTIGCILAAAIVSLVLLLSLLCILYSCCWLASLLLLARLQLLVIWLMATILFLASHPSILPLFSINQLINTQSPDDVIVHCKKRLADFPSPAGMSLTKLSLGGNN